MRHNLGFAPRAIVFCAFFAALLAGCSDERTQSVVPGPAQGANLSASLPTSEMMRAATGLSHHPMPLDRRAWRESLRRHYPAAFRAEGRSGSVLLDVNIDREGIVRRVDVVTPPAESGAPGAVRHRAVLLDKDPRTGETVERVIDDNYDPAFGPAARAVLMETRFSPAMRDGKPVAVTHRMTIGFAPPAANR